MKTLSVSSAEPLVPSSGFHLGRHLLAEFYECDPNVLNNVQLIEEHMAQAALECGATIIQKSFHLFNPYGVSGVVIIAESHLAIHTWPEYGYAAVDLFTCGDHCDPKVAYEFLRKAFCAGSANYSQLSRGFMSPEGSQVLNMPFAIESQQETFVETNLAQKVLLNSAGGGL